VKRPTLELLGTDGRLRLLTEYIAALRAEFHAIRKTHPFTIETIGFAMLKPPYRLIPELLGANPFGAMPHKGPAATASQFQRPVTPP
jgi:hypothetical protein